jgi:hypothetical protein
MLKLLFATAALTALSFAGAQAGTLKDGVWTSTCTMPGDAPAFSSKSPQAYNESMKAAQEWQGSAKAYADCLNNDAKTDQGLIVTTANGNVTKLSAQITDLNAASADAVDKLKKKAAK